MRSKHDAVRAWACAGIVVASLAVMLGAGPCCFFLYTLSSTSDGEGPAPKCKAGQMVCECEKASAPEAPGQTNRTKTLTLRLAKCKCFQSPYPTDYAHVACSTSPGADWVAMRPPTSTNPDICCWVRISDQHNFSYFDQTYQVEGCDGTLCKVH